MPPLEDGFSIAILVRAVRSGTDLNIRAPSAGYDVSSNRPALLFIYLFGSWDLNESKDVGIGVGGEDKGARLVSIELALRYLDLV